VEDYAPDMSGVPYYKWLGVDFLGAGSAQVRLPAQGDLANRKGHMHGGAVLGLVDATASYVTRRDRPEVKGLSTISLACNFVAPGAGDLFAEGTLLGGGRSVVSVSVRVVDSRSANVAAALVTLRLFLTDKHRDIGLEK
jgi:uncharacterized protein (TIGR00369 family)